MTKAIPIAVIAPAVPVEFFGVLWDGIWSAARELRSLGVKVEAFETNGHDLDAQKQILASLAKGHYSAIAIVCAHSTALNALIAQHAASGTCVITFNTDAPASARHSFVGPDAKQGGALAGELLGKLMNGQGKLLSFPGVVHTQNLADRYEGLIEELERSAPAVKEVVCCGDSDDLDAAANDVLLANPDATGIYVGYSRIYQVAATLERLNLHIPCVGFNNTAAVRPYLKEGWVAAVVEENAYQQGYIALQRAYEATLETGAQLSSWVRVPSTVVLRSNAADPNQGESLNEAFELLIRQRTSKLRSYQEKLKEANIKLLQFAETDALTGLLNRRKFEEVIEALVASRRSSGFISLLMADLDGFKGYNDSYGHHVGDEALRAVGRILKKCARAKDFCARLGGDEFCILLPDSSFDAAAEVKARILDEVRHASIAPQTLDLRLRLSIGIATMPRDGVTAEDLIVAADRAMYSEKRYGRPVTAIFKASAFSLR